jgi:DNA polymerase-3 subunit gamma/tau
MILSIMDYIVTARKWRPQRFDQVVGQEPITHTLKNAVRLKRIHQAYLFAGPRGVGKTTTARILARAVNCKNPQDAEPCNECDSCKAILSGTSLDVIEIDGASNNSVDDVRNLRESAIYPPIAGKYKIYIIDEVHMLSTSAFNALLKILEEPPKHLIFIFATTEPHKVLPTIASRCQRFDFHRIEIDTIIKNISNIASAEGIEIDEMSLFTIAKKADGSLRDAQSIFDQFVASSGKVILFDNIKSILHIIDNEYFFKVSDAYKQKNPQMAFEISEELTKNGYDYSEFLSGLLEHFRNLLFARVTGKVENLGLPKAFAQKYLDESLHIEIKDLIRILNLISQAEQQFKFASMPKIRLELLLLQIIEMPSTLEISALINEIKSLKNIPQAQVVSETKPTPSLPQTNSPRSKPAEELPEWDRFLEKYNSKINGLKAFMQSGTLKVEIREKQIVLIAGKELTYTNIESKLKVINQAVKEFFGQEFDLKLILADKEAAHSEFPNTKETEQVPAETNVAPTAPPESKTEVEKLLVDLFNAREIPLSK